MGVKAAAMGHHVFKMTATKCGSSTVSIFSIILVSGLHRVSNVGEYRYRKRNLPQRPSPNHRPHQERSQTSLQEVRRKRKVLDDDDVCSLSLEGRGWGSRLRMQKLYLEPYLDLALALEPHLKLQLAREPQG